MPARMTIKNEAKSESFETTVPRKKGAWSIDEDNTLFKYGTELVNIARLRGFRIDWKKVAAHIPARNSKQVRERWVNHLDPNITRKKWTPKEDAKLMAACVNAPSRWAYVSRSLPGRTENQVKVRYQALARSQRRREKTISFCNARALAALHHKTETISTTTININNTITKDTAVSAAEWALADSALTSLARAQIQVQQTQIQTQKVHFYTQQPQILDPTITSKFVPTREITAPSPVHTTSVACTKMVDDERPMSLMDLPLNGCASPLDNVSICSGSSSHNNFLGQRYEFQL